MKQKHKAVWICSIAIVFCIAAIIITKTWSNDGSRYSRKVEDNLFSLSMEQLNCTIAEPFSLREGDTIDVSVAHISGELSISIGQENKEPVYIGRNPELGSFQITIPEDGDYLISVSGKHAEGSISFRINRTS